MKHYKAIIIDGKKCIKRLLGFLLLTAVFSLIIAGLFSNPSRFTDTDFLSEHIIRQTIPAADAAKGGYQTALQKTADSLKKLALRFLGFDPSVSHSILTAELPFTKQVQATPLFQISQQATSKEVATPTPTAPVTIPEENRAPIKSVDLSPDKSKSGSILIGNETSYSIDIQGMLNQPLSLDFSLDGPKVLVIHTHATESYSPEGSEVYDITAGDRSQNIEENVVRVGKVLCDILNQKGIYAIHDTTLHDVPSFNGSYAHSLTAMENYLKRYPSIQVILDVHRDSIVYSDDTKARPLTQIRGKNAAQLMLVVGTDEKGLEHPNWRENLKAAIHFQNAINQKYPTLMRHINLRKERFNGHTSKASMIIETGASGNSLAEAEYGISLLAECVADYLNDF
ncbi:MAG: stage II sporulation protein P [Clostridia bacterium]|nr:stage II sporulation protein P [Clostridia bacterium]